VGSSAAPAVADWDEDGRKDLILGSLDGKVRYFRNEGTDTAPDFRNMVVLRENGVDLVVPNWRSTPVIADIDGDGKKDLLSGDSVGGILFYANQGTNAAPVFSGYVDITSDGLPLYLPLPGRSKPCLCDWTGDGLLDLVIGGADTMVHLYQGIEPISTFCFGDGSGTACPCSNPGGAGEGCANSTGSGAALGGDGSTSVLAADLTLVATGAIVGQAGLFFQGNGALNGGDGITFGDGLRCAGAGVTRLEVRVPDASGAAATTVDLGAAGGVVAGDVRYYQFWYRDPVGSPCGDGFNTSNGVEVLWLP